jgi:hypothetical protein
MIAETIIGALVPVGVEGVKQVIARFFGGVRATTIEEQIKLDENEIKRIEALARLDTPVGTPSQWVVDLRASARYVGALAVIAVGILVILMNADAKVQEIGLQAANIAFGFLFGSRIVTGWQKK